ncbi:hypothetical protein ACIJDO_001723 [Enterococcus hirae]
MILKNSKTCTIVSLGLLGSCIALGVVPFVIKEQAAWLLLSYYSCCVLSGVSLIFSRGSRSKFLKWFVMIIHFLCIYGLVIPFMFGWMSFGRYDWIIAGIIYLVLSLMLLPDLKKSKWGVTVMLGIPLLFSTFFFIWMHYFMLFFSFGFEIIGFLILLTYVSLIGLILSTQLPAGKIKCIVLGINYFFATYFHVVFLLYIIFDL